jgi:hypothetical protein
MVEAVLSTFVCFALELSPAAPNKKCYRAARFARRDFLRFVKTMKTGCFELKSKECGH